MKIEFFLSFCHMSLLSRNKHSKLSKPHSTTCYRLLKSLIYLQRIVFAYGYGHVSRIVWGIVYKERGG